MLNKIKKFFSVIFDAIVESQKLRAQARLRFHNKGLFNTDTD